MAARKPLVAQSNVDESYQQVWLDPFVIQALEYAPEFGKLTLTFEHGQIKREISVQETKLLVKREDVRREYTEGRRRSI